MSWNSRSVAVAKEKQVGKSKTGRVVEEEEGEKENSSKRVNVTRELQIKAISNKEGKNMEMDKEVVLRRIRQRKRVNKLRAALQALCEKKENPYLSYHLCPTLDATSNTKISMGAQTDCHQTCNSKSIKSFSYPFGFSSGCKIRLNCTPGGGILIGDYPVHSINSDTIIVSVKSQCNRPLDSLRPLFSEKYAPTTRNAILLQNCSETVSPCVIPETMVQTHFEFQNCNSGAGNLSCYYENSTRGFMSYQNLTKSHCSYLMSSIAAEDVSDIWGTKTETALSFEVETIELGWWLQGHCQCSPEANCTTLDSPVDKKPAYRCRCKEGFVGDGYSAGKGCRKASSTCNPAKYMSGQCGGTTRFVVLIGGIVFGAFLMVGLGLICCFFRRRSKLRVTKSTKRRLTEATSNHSVPIYTYKDIERATNSFSDKQRLGTGAYATVYAGKLHNHEWVAIKRIKHRDTDSIEKVMNEIKLISSVSHPNLVRLLGCSIEYGEQILVYEFMPNGTLNQHLQRERGNGLTWPVRLTIATETAQAIAHLHSAINPPIYHRDIKSSNILLDYHFRSKVADFGLSRLGMTEISHISTAPQGTPGYVDPQYHQDFHLSDKSDVYSFGVVLVEIITGLKVVDFSRPQSAVNLASYASDRIGKGMLDEIIDPFLEANRDAWTFSSMHKVAELAFRCLAFHRDMRPAMTEVAAELEQIRLSRWTAFEDNNNGIGTASTELSSSSSSSSSNESEKPLSVKTEEEGKGLLRLHTEPPALNPMEKPRDSSPVSVQDPHFWLSQHSSPSSNSLLSKSFG
ncbi:wall-associated receptor kinase-like 14 [Senna tora]|uniref:Wall-associated receptor kinase-like 14 n=1 Tax=Senna tora TaxID=362788 RepID=A0A834WRP2_9FABA|nr:wall-associated receptor kinase-like 14 [Senna tora]